MPAGIAPGPWEVREEMPGVHRIMAGGECIAEVYSDREAPAVAALPDLLASLEETIDLLVPYGDEEADEAGSIGAALVRARAALAKARGEG